VLTFPRAHSITQAVGDSAVIVSRDQESELMSSLKAPCKKPYWVLHKVNNYSQDYCHIRHIEFFAFIAIKVTCTSQGAHV